MGSRKQTLQNKCSDFTILIINGTGYKGNNIAPVSVPEQKI